MKIVFDGNPLIRSNKSGIGYYVNGLISGLAQSDNDKIYGYYFNFLNRRQLDGQLSSLGVKFRQSKFIPGRIISGLRKVNIEAPLSFLAKDSYDVALFTNYISSPTPKKTRRVVFIYDLCFLDQPQYVSDKNAEFLKKWVPRSLRLADLVVTISDFTKSRIIEHYKINGKKIYVTPIPPVTTHTKTHKINKINIDKYFLFVGTIEPRKNILGLLEEYEMLSNSIRDKYPLVLAGGKGWKDESIIAKISELQKNGENIIQLGYVDDEQKSELYKNATLCIMPSHYEGFGMPIIEAMSYGKVIICSDIPVFHEVGGTAAHYFDKNKRGALSKLIVNILNSSSIIQLSEKKGLELANKYPTWEIVGKDFRKKLLQIVS